MDDSPESGPSPSRFAGPAAAERINVTDLTGPQAHKPVFDMLPESVLISAKRGTP